MYYTLGDIGIPPKMIEFLDTTSKFGDGMIVQNGQAVLSDTRRTKVCMRYDNDWVGKFCRHHVQVINEDEYKFNLNDGFSDGRYQYAHYHVGHKYDWHVDQIWKNNQLWHRKLSFSLILNDDYEGGHFEFVEPVYGSELGWNIQRIPCKAGTMIVFPSIHAHRVTPVTKGIRKSLVGWCVGRQFV